VKDYPTATKEEVVTYEELRQTALARPGRKNGDYGHAVLISRGVAAWLRALSSYAPRKGVRLRKTEPARGEHLSDVKAEMTEVLIRMAFSVAR
jgi:hypothetical protein